MHGGSIFEETVLRQGAVEVVIRHFPATNYALVHNVIPVVVAVEARNRSAELASNPIEIIATLNGFDNDEIADEEAIPIPTLSNNGFYQSTGRGHIRPKLEKVAGRTEGFPARLEFSVKGDVGVGVDTIDEESLKKDAELFGAEIDLSEKLHAAPDFRVLAENEWFNSPAFFESLSAFVQPNTSEVRKVLEVASTLLLEQTGDSGLQGYQHGTERATLIALAIYEALRSMSIRYINPPASFEKTGQRIRSTVEVLGTKFGTCIDLSVAYAAACEAAGLKPLLALVDGHAIAGIMLSETSSVEPTILEEGAVRNLVTAKQVLMIDAVFYEEIDFKTACERGRRIIAETPVRGLVDVAASRRDGMRPIPTQNTDEDVSDDKIETSAEGDSSRWAIPDIGSETGDVDRIIQNDESPRRVQNWKQSLLDLSMRNRLLNIKSSAEVLEFKLPDAGLAVLDDIIHAGKPVSLYGHDAVSDNRNLQGIRTVAELPDEQVLDDLVTYQRAYVKVSEYRYKTALSKLIRDVKTLTEETGSSNLYLALGGMEISNSTGRPVIAPLFLVPVKFGGGSGRSRFTISVDSSMPATPNYCLVEWLRAKHGAVVSSLSEPPLDESGLDIELALREISQRLTELDLPYEVRETAFVGICKFSTYGMWRDLEENWGAFNRSPVFRHLVEKSGSSFVDPVDSSDIRDLVVTEEELTLPIAADGAQMQAIVAAAEGRSFVLEGPPGTGKSQTIANLVTHCLLNGKTLLFVAEKQAALQVVQGRLAKAGLGEFTLDLHGVEQKPANIREQLKRSIDLEVSYDGRTWRNYVDRFRNRLIPLTEYPEKIHETNAAQHSLWTAVETLEECGDGPSLPVTEQTVRSQAVDSLELDDILRDFERVARGSTVSDHPEWALVGPGASDVSDSEIKDAVSYLETTLGELPAALRLAIADQAKQHMDESTKFLEPLILHLEELHARGDVPARDLESEATRETSSRLKSLAAHIKTLQQRILPIRNVVTDQALLTGDFQRAAQLADSIESKLLGKKKRQAEFESWITPLLRNPGSVLPERAGNLALDVERSRAEIDNLNASLNQELASTPLFGRSCLDSGLAAELLSRASEFDAIADSIDEQAKFATQYPSLRELIATHGVDFDDVESIQKFDTALEDLKSKLDVSYSTSLRWCDGRIWTTALEDSLSLWKEDLHNRGAESVRQRARLMRAIEPLRDAGLVEAASALIEGDVPTYDLTIALRRGLAEASIQERLDNAGLKHFSEQLRAGEVEDLVRASQKMREESKDALAARLLDRRNFRPNRLEGQVAELARQLTTKRRALTFRQLMEIYGEEIKSITPCFFVSPASLARFVPADSELFDIVVFDEASQVTVEQAVGALGRAKSAVIVGDSQQMPPTRFGQASRTSDDFDLDTDETSALVPDDLDSILTECVESGLPRLWLTWHYRSQDESLIAFSNQQYYEGKLSSLPTPGGIGSSGIEFRRVGGHFYRSVSKSAPDEESPSFNYGIVASLRTNPIEAEAIIDEIIARVNDPLFASQSIGVVTFNIQQRDLILDALEKCGDPLVAARLADEDEPIFVKNLENVQGDERDVILFSTAFSAKAKGEKLPLNFGPLSRSGGEKRLNVAVTRARSKVIVFSSFDPSDIDLERTSSRGLKDLRGYLESAGQSGESSGSAARRKSSIRDSLARRLNDRGLEVCPEFGLSEFSVDLAVRHPGAGRWECAVLLDGPRWAGMPTVADRELTPNLLSSLMRWGAVERVWVPEWQANPNGVVDRIVGAAARAKAELEKVDEEIELARQANLAEIERTKNDATELDDTESQPHLEEPIEDVSLEWDEDAAASSVALDLVDSEDAAFSEEKLVAENSVASATSTTPQAGSRVEEHVHPLVQRKSSEAGRPETGEKQVSGITVTKFFRIPDRLLGTKEDLDNDLKPAVRQAILQRLEEIVRVEAPMTKEALARRLGDSFGVGRVSGRMKNIFLADLPNELIQTSHGETFVWPAHTSPSEYSTVRTGVGRGLSEIPLEEIANAVLALQVADKESGDKEILRAFGLTRLTAGQSTRIRLAREVAAEESINGNGPTNGS